MHFTRWFYAAPLRLRSLFRRPQVERELDEEIGYHIERQIQENTAKGLTPDEARYAALRTFSGVDRSKEACRDTLRVNVIGDLFQDLRYVLRTLRHSPGFTTVAVLSLALGIGANIAVFSAIDPLFLRRVAVQNAGELISFRAVRPDLRLLMPFMSAANLSFYTRPGLSYREFQRLRDGNQSFSGVFTFTAANNARILAGAGDSVGQVEEVRAQQASGGYFSTLEVAPALGRLFDETDERIESQPVVVISHSFWQRRFGLAPDIIGKPISFVSSADPRSIGGRLAATIIGVAPAGFSGPEVGACCDVWAPLVDKPIGRSPLDPTWWSITRPMMGRLQPGLTLKQARTEINAAYRRALDGWTEEFGADWTPQQRQQFLNQKLIVESGATGWSGLRDQFGQRLWILMATVGCVLLIACANVATLLLARSAVRQKELAVRMAIGSGRSRLIRQLLTESITLAAIGGIAGLLVAYAGARLLLGYIPALSILNIGLNMRVLAFTMATCLASAVLFGLAPAMRSTKLDLNLALKSGQRGFGRTRLHWAPTKILVALQIALSLVLLVSAGLFVRTLYNLRHLDASFDKDAVVLFFLDRPLPLEVHQQLLARIESFPGVRSAAAWDAGLLNSSGRSSSIGPIVVNGYTPGPGEDVSSNVSYVGSRFFETSGISLLTGRDFRADDTQLDRNVAVISRALARHFFGSENPIGRYFRPGSGKDAPQIEIIGVAEDTKYVSLKDQTQQTIYVPLGSHYLSSSRRETKNFAVQLSQANSGSHADAIRSAVREIDPKLRVVSIRSMNEVVESTLVQERLMAQVAGLFSLLALLLACVGLYGTMSHAVAQRTNEIGIRMALGARIADVIAMLMRETGWIVGTGVGIGLLGAAAVTRTVSTLLFGLTPSDPSTIAFAALLLATAAAIAAYLPARRASRVDPIVALRHE